MGKRHGQPPIDEEPPSKKAASSMSHSSHLNIDPGEILTDISGKRWRLGKPIGLGAFGEIYTASDDLDNEVDEDCEYVMKIENHTNGPLFVEINCYLRIAKLNMINEWKEHNNITHLGMPHYIASGSHYIKDVKYRFLVLPRYKTDIEGILQNRNYKLNLKTVLTMCIQLIDVLQYIHSKGFIHADIKASNILLRSNKDEQSPTEQNSPKRLFRIMNHHGHVRNCRLATTPTISRNLRSHRNLHTIEQLLSPSNRPKPNVESVDQIYLLDYGLASKYILSNGEHCKDCADERRAHAGTILFCSLDAHKGVLSRRSDLESLGYNIIYWLTSSLPWHNNISDPEVVKKKKQRCMSHLEHFLTFCFGQYPKFILQYLKMIKNLEATEMPNYSKYKKLFKNALKEYGYKDNGKLDFDNSEGWGCKIKKKKKINSENMQQKKLAYAINRTPLKSNLQRRPVLRKKENKQLTAMNWSKLLFESELVLKRKVRDSRPPSVESDSVSLSDIDIQSLNPTKAMCEVYNNYINKGNADGGCSPRHKGDANSNTIDGYTSAMMQVYNSMIERKELELEKISKLNNDTSRKNRSTKQIKKSSPKKRTKSSGPQRKRVERKKSRTPNRIYRLRG